MWNSRLWPLFSSLEKCAARLISSNLFGVIILPVDKLSYGVHQLWKWSCEKNDSPVGQRGDGAAVSKGKHLRDLMLLEKVIRCYEAHRAHQFFVPDD